MTKPLFAALLIFSFLMPLAAQTPQPVKQLLKADYMQGATFSLMVKDVQTGDVLYEYDAGREVTPASVLKTVTTATALELLGEDYRFPTSLEYDGKLTDGTLHGNLYIKGSGDPTLGSAHLTPDKNSFTPARYAFITQWTAALQRAGIHKITGSVISDESIFDTEGISPKWQHEDMGNYYGAGSYGLNIFDNAYALCLSTGNAGERPVIEGSEPDITIRYHNYLTVATVQTDRAVIAGFPFLPERYLYGVVPANRPAYTLKGDIPDPALFLAEFLTEQLRRNGIAIDNPPSCHRIQAEAGHPLSRERQTLVTTYSPPLRQIVRITNERSHNLYADALLKTLGLRYTPARGEVITSFGRGIKTVQSHWQKKGIDTTPLRMYDGSGTALADKVSAAFLADMLAGMADRSPASEAFLQSLPKAGSEGTVANFLRGSSLQGKALLKSGSMTRVRCYAGYVRKGDRQYAVALLANNYSCKDRQMVQALEKLLLALFTN
ncbi:D-alanyl-D-alanine carboxypeptidase dacC precursor [Bacteroidales bacterium Barb4]|nr:D-alanyl-D-alanine carboxypeptidase dacC precursor [Bacteroidales bacterium Barb4]